MSNERVVEYIDPHVFRLLRNSESFKNSAEEELKRAKLLEGLDQDVLHDPEALMYKRFASAFQDVSREMEIIANNLKDELRFALASREKAESSKE